MKELQKYRVIRAYGPYRVGDIIQPTGMLRDELRACGRITKVEDEPPAQDPAPTQEPEPVEDIIDEEPDPLVVAATLPIPETAARPAGRRGRYGR